jgi:peptidoglycan/xylan/chitin deacetylase (PgdA/CDA1 family)
MIGSPTVILCYHRVNDGVSDPFHLCVSPDHFDAHLTILKQKAAVVTLDEVCEPSRSPRVVITFDDGYVDNLQQAVPVAQAHDVPITVYVASGMIGDRRGFWWDRLAHLLHYEPGGPRALRTTVAGEDVDVALGDPDQCLQARDELHRRLRPRPPAEIAGVLDRVAEQLDRDGAAPDDARPLEADELQRLARTDVVTIGAHTVDHALLRSQAPDAQRDTIATSKATLESELAIGVDHFAYPFGGHDSFDTETVAAARAAGFSTATTTVPGSVGAAPDPFTLHRRMVMNWAPVRFRAQVLRWGIL